MATTIHVENISRQTSEKEVRDFFSFCGKIRDLSVTPVSDTAQSATVTFEKETAAKTALLLDRTQLGPSEVHVTAAKTLDELAGSNNGDDAQKDAQEVAQEDKPRSRIIAEYLAHGYVISDKAIERAINLDKQHGISGRFTNALKTFDEKFKATDKAHAVDVKYGVTDKAMQGWRGMNSYFEKALGTPTGQKLRKFYETSNKQVTDVHNEARHLADLKKSSQTASPENIPGTDKTKCTCTSDSGKCGCAPGKCACPGCAKNTETESKVSPEDAQMEKVPGTDKTKCNCGGAAGKCSCPPGKCSCAHCAKNPDDSKTASNASAASHGGSTDKPSAASA